MFILLHTYLCSDWHKALDLHLTLVSYVPKINKVHQSVFLLFLIQLNPQHKVNVYSKFSNEYRINQFNECRNQFINDCSLKFNISREKH